MKIFKDEKGFREVNPFFKSTGQQMTTQWDMFEATVTHHDCPELTNAKIGEVYEAELVWQFSFSGDADDWRNSDPRAYKVYSSFEEYDKSEKYSQHRQIFRLIPEKQPSVEVKGETAEDEMNRALRCLYVAVHSSIADDVKNKVNAAFSLQSSEIRELREENDELRGFLNRLITAALPHSTPTNTLNMRIKEAMTILNPK